MSIFQTIAVCCSIIAAGVIISSAQSETRAVGTYALTSTNWNSGLLLYRTDTGQMWYCPANEAYGSCKAKKPPEGG